MNKTELFRTYQEFLDRPDKSVNGVSPAFAEKHPGYEQQNATNKGCYDCSRCSGCYDCSRCSRKKGDFPVVPKVANLDVALYQAVSQPDALDMSTWHSCGTTHCRAGWIVALAGEEGKALESFFNTELAAMLIYKESTGTAISPARFYDDNETALEDMRKRAGE